MNPRALAVVLLRASGLVSVLSAFFHVISYSVPYWFSEAQSKRVPTASGYTTSILLPSLTTIVGGVIILVFAVPLARFVSRGVE